MKWFMTWSIVLPIIALAGTDRLNADLVTAGLIHLYQAEGNANDSKGTANGATFGDTTYGTGVFGQAFVFDGSGDFMEVAQSLIPSSGDFSIGLWVNEDIQTGTIQEFVSQGVTSGPGSGSFYIGTALNSGLDWIRVSDDWGNTGLSSMQGTGWHHYALTRDSLNTLLYIDGSLAASKGSAIGNPPGGNFRLARQFGSFSEYFSGKIDQVTIYDRALTAGEVLQLSTVPEPGLAGLGLLGCAAFAVSFRRRRNPVEADIPA